MIATSAPRSPCFEAGARKALTCRRKRDSEDHNGAASIKVEAQALPRDHAVARIEEWFVEAETADEARALLRAGDASRAQIGECIHFEVDKLMD